MGLGVLTEVKDLRKVWPHEALDFTPWLAKEENITLLGDAVGLEITVNETESGVGDFSVDIFATETGTERKIIIENQLEDTDHDHLGKLITYASGKAANIIIWVVKRAREEHRAAIEWLNNHTDENISFFLVEIKLYRIGNSEIALKFEVVEKPNDWTKDIKRKNNTSQADQEKYDYWVAFNEYAFNDPAFSQEFKMRKARPSYWMVLSVGSSACRIDVMQLRRDKAIAIEWYIPDDKDLYQTLYTHRTEIEAELGMTLKWKNLDNKKASYLFISRNADPADKEDWPNQFDWLMDVALKMKKTIRKYI